MSERVTDAMVDAARTVLREWYDLAGYAAVQDYIQSPEDPPPGPQRDAALAALRAADEEADRIVNERMRAAIIAALRVEEGGTS